MRKLSMVAIIFLFSLAAVAQDAMTLIRTHEERIYTPRQKALTDLVVDLVNPDITKQLNEQMIFGHLKEVSFRVYWTSSPERIAIEVLGMPEGFNEIKQELKNIMINRFETIIPLPLEKKFTGFRLQLSADKKGITFKDDKGLHPIPEFALEFDANGLVQKVTGKKPVGKVETTYTYAKTAWSDPRFYVTGIKTVSSDGPQQTVSTSDISWTTVSGIGLPEKISSKTTQRISIPDSSGKTSERTISESLLFENYKANQGEAMKWFLAQAGQNKAEN